LKELVVKKEAQGSSSTEEDSWAFELGYTPVPKDQLPLGYQGVTMMHIRNLLNKCRWDPNMPPEYKIRIEYKDSEIEEGVAITTLAAVSDISFANVTLLGDTIVPFHRIQKVTVDGKVLWSKLPSPGKDRYTKKGRIWKRKRKK